MFGQWNSVSFGEWSELTPTGFNPVWLINFNQII